MTNLEPTTAPSRSHKHWRAIGILFLVFVFGVICGGGGTILVVVERLKASVRSPETAWAPAERMLNRAANRLDRKLDLTPDQAQQVREELKITLQQMREVRTSVAAESRMIMIDTTRRIESRLPTDKQATFREMANQFLTDWELNELEP